MDLALALLASAPAFAVERLAPEIAEDAILAWESVASRFASATGVTARPPADPIVLRAAPLSGRTAARSTSGVVLLRSGLDPKRLETTLRHELAHQLAFGTCPEASEDSVFHEALALSLSGELEGWTEPYLSRDRALEILATDEDLDRSDARRALARLLMHRPSASTFAPSLAVRSARCGSGRQWPPPMRPAELLEAFAFSDSTVVLSRHTGELLFASGAHEAPVPFGSTLKPFVIATGTWPPLTPEGPEWDDCSSNDNHPMSAEAALAVSCNPWFMSAGKRRSLHYGELQPVLEALGIERAPRTTEEAIGLVPSLTLTPLALAQAYRVLAEARPEVLAMLRRTAKEGTLSGLSESPKLSLVATKTGTVRAADAAPELGLIAAVDEDTVVVLVRFGRAPRTFTRELLGELERARQPSNRTVRVQILGLIPETSVELACGGFGVRIVRGPNRALTPFRGWLAGSGLAPGERVLCGKGALALRAQGVEARPYPGILSFDPPTRRAKAESPRAQRARRGSSFVLSTTAITYASGVVEAEASTLRGAPREALVRVVAHNAEHSPHPGRPVCDTTHCQVFLGAKPHRPEDTSALALEPLAIEDWLPFSAGGDEAWSEASSRKALDDALGSNVSSLSLGPRVRFLRTIVDRAGARDEPVEIPCESLRNLLRLPSCPDRVTFDGSSVRFEGHGRGHGLGLSLVDLETARGTSDDILRHVYGAKVLRR